MFSFVGRIRHKNEFINQYFKLLKANVIQFEKRWLYIKFVCVIEEVITRSPGTWITMPSCKMFQVKTEIVNTIGTPTDIVIKLFCLKDTGQILNTSIEREREKESKMDT